MIAVVVSELVHPACAGCSAEDEFLFDGLCRQCSDAQDAVEQGEVVEQGVILAWCPYCLAAKVGQ